MKLEYCVCVSRRLTPNASGSGAERPDALKRAVHVLIADDRFFATRRFEDEAEYIYFKYIARRGHGLQARRVDSSKQSRKFGENLRDHFCASRLIS